MNFKIPGIIILLFVQGIIVHAQAPVNIFSGHKGDTALINALLKQSKEMLSDDPAKAIKLAKQAKVLSERINYLRGKGYSLKNIGLAYYYQGIFTDALASWNESLKVFEILKDDIGIANLLNNIGGLYADEGNDEKGLEYCLRSLSISEKLGDTLRILSALNTVGSIYYDKKATWNKAVTYFLQALLLSEAIGDKDAIGFISANIGEIYLQQNDFVKSKSFYQKTIKALGDAPNSSFAYSGIGKIYLNQGDFEQALNYNNKSLAIAEKTKSKPHIVRAFQGIANVYIAKKDYTNALIYFNKASVIAEEVKAPVDLKDIYQGMAIAYDKTGDYKKAYKYRTMYADIKDTLYNTETDKKLGKLQFEFDIQKKQTQVDLLTKDKALQVLDIKQQKVEKNALIGGLLLVFFIMLFIYRGYRIKIRLNKVLDKQKAEIEGLLLNILPAEVAVELQKTGVATPRYYEKATVLFTDFKNFSQIADDLSPQEVVTELNEFFVGFDDIIDKYKLEKIKTIGDSYMCAGGIPTEDDDHVIKIIKASLEIQEFTIGRNQNRIAQNLPPWDIRVGVNTGPLVAGVVGKKKYAYDIWGGTVNVASRMESNGVAGRVNISAATYEFIKDQYACTHRGKIYAKNIGDIDMYFVDHAVI